MKCSPISKRYLFACAIAVMFCTMTPLSGGAKFVKMTALYKTAGNLDIKTDMYRPDDEQVRPVVVWIHGGALINGSCKGVPERIHKLCQQEGFVLVSLDYRLAPEVKIRAIVEDIQAAFLWMRGDGAKQFHLDPENIVVTGGYLAMMTGHCIRPRPLALVAYWGYGDVDGKWLREPSSFYRESIPLISKEEAYAAVGKKVISGTDARDIDPRARGRYYLFLRQNGLWTKEVTGFDPATQKDKLDYYCPVRNLTADYPPILMVHGTKDTDVPYEESADMGAELKKKGVQHELVTVQGAGHGLSGGNTEEVKQAHDKAIEFILGYLKK